MKRLALAARTAFLALIVYESVASGLAGLFLLTPFLASLPLLYLARKDERYYLADAALSALFIAAAFLPFALTSTLFGPDKLFHAAAGAILAYPALLFYSKHADNEWVAAIAATATAVALGAGWEVFELAFFSLLEPSQITALTYQDTVLDLVADGLGAALLALSLTKRL